MLAMLETGESGVTSPGALPAQPSHTTLGQAGGPAARQTQMNLASQSDPSPGGLISL